MRHVDPDTLALLALGEKVADSDAPEHLAQCDECSAELTHFSRAVSAGRSTLDAGELVEPAPRVWTRISDELGLAAEPQPAPVIELAPRRRWVPVVGIAASVALVASVGLTAWGITRPTPAIVLASATLDSFPNWPDATGKAVVEESTDGTRVVQVSFDAPGLGDEYTEVWLISSDATRLVSLGTVAGSRGTLTIPAGVDLSIYDLVDVSAEPYDGDPAHSGDSILRGRLA